MEDQFQSDLIRYPAKGDPGAGFGQSQAVIVSGVAGIHPRDDLTGRIDKRHLIARPARRSAFDLDQKVPPIIVVPNLNIDPPIPRSPIFKVPPPPFGAEILDDAPLYEFLIYCGSGLGVFRLFHKTIHPDLTTPLAPVVRNHHPHLPTWRTQLQHWGRSIHPSSS